MRVCLRAHVCLRSFIILAAYLAYLSVRRVGEIFGGKKKKKKKKKKVYLIPCLAQALSPFGSLS